MSLERKCTVRQEDNGTVEGLEWHGNGVTAVVTKQ